MSLRVVWKEIKDCKYSITTMNGDKALEYFGTLAKFLGGSLGKALTSGLSSAEGDSTKVQALIGGALTELGQHMATPEFRELVYAMLEGATVQYNGHNTILIQGGNKEAFKGHFNGDIGALLALAWFALEENYGSFLDGFPVIAGMLKGRMKGEALDKLLSRAGMTGGSPA